MKKPKDDQKKVYFQRAAAIFLAAGLLSHNVYAIDDSDNDGVPDSQDNCLEIANPDQRNTNADNFGNLCDGDLNNDGSTNTLDLSLYKLAHRTQQGDSAFNPDADFNGDGRINTLDLSIYKTLHRKPPGPSGISNTLTTAKAAHFLTQSTFGPTLADINYLVDESASYDAWLNEQFSKPATLQLPAMRALEIKMCRVDSNAPPLIAGGRRAARTQAWWETAVKGDDQLRQRVALALSEILVVSARSPLYYTQYGLASYYDVLARNAFGNFRELLEEVTLHPAMGRYLGMLRNEKVDSTGTILPDENYAREVMQLFTIGVHQLNIDGSLALDAQNNPIPTYGQGEVEEFAKVFTGWGFANDSTWGEVWIGSGDIVHPMKAFDAFHDTSEKHLLNNHVVVAGGTAKQDLEAALNNLFEHQNVAPFISKQLIQRLITSNPTKEYVERVASVFNNNGAGVKGDLKAVVTAILMDDEARNGHQSMPDTFGKIREPIMRITHLWRAFPVMPIVIDDGCGQGEYDSYRIPYGGGLGSFERVLGQTVLRSPTVFNFFLPDYSPQGVLRDHQLIAPEFQIMTENILVETFNAIAEMVHYSNRYDNGYTAWTTIDTTQELALVDTPNELLAHLNLVLLNNRMSAELRQILLNHLGQPFQQGEHGRQARVRDSIILILSSPEYLIQQ